VTNELVPLSPTLALVGLAANEAASAFSFGDYVRRKSKNTVKNQRVDLASFAEYLAVIGIATTADDLQSTAVAWKGISWGVVSGFVQWALQNSFATGTISRRLSTIKVYAAMAMQAGAIPPEEYTKMQTVHAYAGKEADRIDQRRVDTGVAVRKGTKKSEATEINDEQAARLKSHPDTPQGLRDRLLMCLLLDHGLRVGEVALLTRKNFIKKGKINFYRPKVDLWQTHLLSADVKAALVAYMASPGNGSTDEEMPIFRATVRSKNLHNPGYTERAIQHRVKALGEAIGLFDLSPHDCRHYWATKTAQMVEDGKISLLRLQEAGGWNSLNMPRRYVKRAEISNKGIV
jgi:integrase